MEEYAAACHYLWYLCFRLSNRKKILMLAWKRGYSPLEMISKKADTAFVDTLRRKFGTPQTSNARIEPRPVEN